MVLSVPRIEIDQGEIVGLMGPNGAGKSTLLLLLALLQKPTSGEIMVEGERVTDRNTLALRRKMAVVFQEPLLLDTSVASNVGTGLGLRGVPRAEKERRVKHWLDRFGILDLASRPAKRLSGGEAQRVSLARAFALNPEILFLDEPFSSLDAPTRQTLLGDLKDILRETNTTTVFVTHDRDEALSLGDRLAVLIAGELRQFDPPGEVLNSPADAEVAAFVGVETVAPGAIVSEEDGLAQVEIGPLTLEVASDLPVGAPVYLMVRPEDITLGLAGQESELKARQTSARNRILCRVLSVSPWRGQTRVDVEASGGMRLVALVTLRSAQELGLAEGVGVWATFKATSAHLIARSD